MQTEILNYYTTHAQTYVQLCDHITCIHMYTKLPNLFL